MTNEQKTEAPKRIWAIDSLEYGWISGFCTKRQPSEAIGTVSFEYTRTDLSQAAVGATVRACAEVLDLHDGAPMVPSEHWAPEERSGYVNGQMDAARSWQEKILALEPDAQQALDDAQQALDDALAAAKAEGVREAIEALSGYDPFDSAAGDLVDILQALLPTDEQKE